MSGKRGSAYSEELTKVITRVRFINWYGFRFETMDWAECMTLLNGDNGSGKTTAADGIKYCLFGDTVFNASAAKKAGRQKPRKMHTITRALKTSGGNDYERPPYGDTAYVYTHVAVEIHDKSKGDGSDAFFVLDTFIETRPSNETSTYRFVLEGKRLEDILFYEEREGKKALFNDKLFEEKNGVVRLKALDGLEKFSNMQGLRLDNRSLTSFRGKFRGLMTYSPESDIPSLVKEAVLEPVDIKITDLKEAKEKYDQQGKILSDIRRENALLDEILEQYRTYDENNRKVIVETIKNNYKNLVDKEAELRNLSEAVDELYKKTDILEREKKDAGIKKTAANDRLSDAKAKYKGEEAAFKVEEQRNAVERAEMELEKAKMRLDKLETFVPRLKAGLDILSDLSEEQRELLNNVHTNALSSAEKWSVLKSVRSQVQINIQTYEESKVKARLETEGIVSDLKELRSELLNIQNHMHFPKRAAEYKELRDLINDALEESGGRRSAKMAYEYVEEVEDEEWRPVIENLLGDDRFCIIVPEEDYSLAYEVQMSSSLRRPRIVRTDYYVNRDLVEDPTMLYSILRVPNMIARKYFASLLNYKMVEKAQVRDFPRAVEKGGFYSVPRWTGYINMNRVDRYCLGFESRRLSMDLIESDMRALGDREKVSRNEYDYAAGMLESLSVLRDALIALIDGDMDLSASANCRKAENELADERKRLKEMDDALKKNPKVQELKEKVIEARAELEAIERTYDSIVQDITVTQESIKATIEKRDIAELIIEGDEDSEDEDAKLGLRGIMDHDEALYPREAETAISEYEDFLLTGDAAKSVIGRRQIQTYAQRRKIADEELRNKQTIYDCNFRRLGQGPDNIEPYIERKRQIEVKDLDEAIFVHNQRKKRCFDTFNNEFLLTIRRSVNDAKAEIRRLNESLKNVGFASTYKIEIKEKQDGDYGKILQQSNKQMLKGKALLEGQVDLLDDISIDGNEYLTEKEMAELMERILEKEDFSEFEDYRNYLEYDVIVEGNGYAEGTRLSRQDGDNSGAERQIPYTIILTCGLLNIYNKRKASTRLLFMDEPFEKLDSKNIEVALNFFKEHNLQVLFVASNKTEEIGVECDMIVPVVNGKDKNGRPDKTDARFAKVERRKSA